MNICICDDEERERKAIRKICEEYFKSRGIPYQISEAVNGLGVLGEESQYDLLILDIEMPGMDGLTLKDRLQNGSSQMRVIFVTSHDEMAEEAFGQYVIGFVRKELLTIKLTRYLALAVTLLGKDVLIERTYHSRDITKIHSEREYCNLHFKDGKTALVRSSLRELEELLREADFVRIHRAWLINLRYVDKLVTTQVLIQGEELSVSRSYRDSLDRAFDNFCERNARYCG